MPTSTDVTTLKINELTEAQYDAAVQGGVIGANELSIITDMDDAIQVDTMPTASVDELGNIYQFIGTTDANYTHGYFYECVSDGGNPATYSWSNVQVQASSGGLPSQTGQSGKFLTTDGTDASWSDKPLVNTATGSGGTGIGDNCQCSGNYSVAVGYYAKANSVSATALGQGAEAGGRAVAVGEGAKATATGSIAIGKAASASSSCSLQINMTSSGTPRTNSDANTVKIANDNGNYEIMSADGTIPADRLVHAINKYSTMPTAASTNEGWIVQYTGTTDSTYTHGHLYECVSDGQATPTYSWTEVQLGGGSSLPSQTGQSGKFLTTDGTDASWAAVNALQNTATGTNSLTIAGTATTRARSTNIGISSAAQGVDTIVVGYNTQSPSGFGDNVLVGNSLTRNSNSSGPNQTVCIGNGAKYSWASVAIGHNAACMDAGVFIGNGAGGQSTAFGNVGSIGLGYFANAKSAYGVSIGYGATTEATHAIQLGHNGTNSDANTFKVANANGNFEIMSADGTIPTARLTKVNTTVTLAAADWSGGSQTVTVNGITATSVVWVSPDPSDQADYVAGGILCTAQAANSLTFTASTTPTNDIDVVVVAM